jgi:acetolactate synthase-1/3 small subunit
MSSQEPDETDDLPKHGLKGPEPEERPHPDGRRNSQGIRIDPEVEGRIEIRNRVHAAEDN